MKTKFFNALSLAVIMAMLVTSLALADDFSIDNDIVSPGNQATVNLTAYANATVTTSAQLFVDWQGSKHLTPGSSATFTVSAGQTTLPSGYTVGNVTHLVPTDWNDTNDNFVPGSSSISFKAPSLPGNYSYSVKWDASSFSCLPDNKGNPVSDCLSGGNAFTINLSVSEPPPPADSTPPAITLNVVGTLGNNGWYASNVTVSWNVNDPESGIASSSGCDTTLINDDTGGTTLTCSATNGAGLSSSQSVTIKRDATAPGITFISPSPAIWYNANVTANWNCSDDTSGVVIASVSATTSGEGTSQAATGACEDNAGNSASDTQYFKVDQTAPSISGSASPAANSYGWNNTDVTVSFTCSDVLSGIVSCGPDQTLIGEGADQSATGNATDDAGNSASATVSNINIDKTAPTASASVSPAANEFGWNNTDVTVSFDGSDGLSDIDFCDAPVVLSGEGAGQSASGTCTDKAGNVSAPAIASGISIDKTPPTITWIGGPQDGASYYFGFVPEEPVISMSDALSGPLNYYYEGNANSVGTNTIKVTAYDKAGNSYSESRTYTVLAWSLTGFYQPVDMNGVYNTVKNGSTVPLKFEIFVGPTELTDVAYIKSLTYALTACSATATTDEIETTATGGTILRYDATSGQFIFNWKTPSTAGKCYRVTMTTLDGSSLIAYFKLK